MKTIILTGASRGLGHELLWLLAPKYKVLAIFRKKPSIPIPDNSTAVIGDLSNELDLEWGILQSDEIIFLDNAAVLALGGIPEISSSSISEAMYVNLLNPILITCSLYRHCIHNKIPFRVIHISTGLAKNAFSGMSLYCSTKAAVDMFYETFRLEGGKVTIIDPGMIDTGMQDQLSNSGGPTERFFSDARARGMLQAPSEVAKKVLIEGRL